MKYGALIHADCIVRREAEGQALSVQLGMN